MNWPSFDNQWAGIAAAGAKSRSDKEQGLQSNLAGLYKAGLDDTAAVTESGITSQGNLGSNSIRSIADNASTIVGAKLRADMADKQLAAAREASNKAMWTQLAGTALQAGAFYATGGMSGLGGAFGAGKAAASAAGGTRFAGDIFTRDLNIPSFGDAMKYNFNGF